MSHKSSHFFRAFMLLAAIVAPLSTGSCGKICGDGTVDKNGTCEPSLLPAPRLETSIRLTSFTSDHSTGELAYADHPINMMVGLTSSGISNIINVTAGLIERRDGDQALTVQDLDARPSCELGTIQVVLNAQGKEERFQIPGTVKSDCIKQISGTGRFSFYLGIDQEGRTGEVETFVVLAPSNVDRLSNQSCKYTTSEGVELGCDAPVQVAPSPGIDAALASFIPDTSIFLAWQEAYFPNRPDLPAARAALNVNWETVMYGKPRNPTASAPPANTDLRVWLAPVFDEFSVGWKPVLLDPGLTRNVPEMAVQKPSGRTNFLYMTQDLISLVFTGPWAKEEDFKVRACLITDFVENGDPMYAGSDGQQNNCIIIPVKLVRAIPPRPTASTYNFESTWSKDSGSSDKIKAYAYLRFKVGADLSNAGYNAPTALTDNQAYLELTADKIGVSKFKLFDALFYADAHSPTSTKSAQVKSDKYIKIVGFELWSSHTSSSSSLSFDYDTSYTKGKDWNFPVVGVPGVSVNFVLGVSGTVGMDYYGKAAYYLGGGGNYSTAKYRLDVSATVAPSVNLTATGGVSVSLGLSAGVKGDLEIFTLKLPLTGSVESGVYLNPTKVTLKPSFKVDLVAETLGGRIYFFIDYLLSDSEWDLLKWTGYSYNYNLLNKSLSSTTIQ